MSYDSWKATNPADQFLGPDPEEKELEPERPATKWCWQLVISLHPYTVGFPGVTADLFFSTKEKARELWGREFERGESLVEVEVPEDFDMWDFVPDEY